MSPRHSCALFRRHAAVLALFTLLFASAAASAQQPAAADVSSQLDKIVQAEMQKQHMVAVTVAVAKDSKVVYSKAFGMADIENDVRATPETLIRTGSIAKPISAVAAMTLAEAGKLDLDAPVQKYCPAFPEKQSKVTTRQLLSHTAGVRHYKQGEIESTKHYKTMSEGFAIFASDPLLFEPGTKYSYSTYGYTVVGCAIESASGQKFADYVREHVLVPAAMTHTFIDDVYEIVPHRARGYQLVSGAVKNAGLMDSSYKIPGGGIVTTSEDLVRFESALLDGTLVRPETRDKMWTPTGVPILNGDRPSPYGLGFDVVKMPPFTRVSHGGSQQGTSTIMAVIPEKRLAVAVMTNVDGVNPSAMMLQILEAYGVQRPAPATR